MMQRQKIDMKFVYLESTPQIWIILDVASLSGPFKWVTNKAMTKCVRVQTDCTLVKLKHT